MLGLLVEIRQNRISTTPIYAGPYYNEARTTEETAGRVSSRNEVYII